MADNEIEEATEDKDKSDSGSPDDNLEKDEVNGENLVATNEEEDQNGKINPEVLQGIPVTISVEVGKTSLKIRDLLRLSQGSVVELDRLAGEPLDLLVNNTVVAQGEIVLVNDRYGIRLTRVVPAAERMKTI
ncbi:MAG: flagellar motor switch protein FliN [Burkholderiaceae bacterium]|nr:MAG: flagellar motor switch protein FliN [Betaproteobacteria bacterium TMED100]